MRWLRAGFLPVSCLVVVIAALVVPMPYVINRPGRPLSLGACVQVEHEQTTPVAGEFLLLTISVEGSTTIRAAQALVDPNAAVVARDRAIGRGVDTNAYYRDQRKKFELMADRAAAVALIDAGFRATITGEGAEIESLQPGGPAEAVLRPRDVIVAVNDATVTGESDLRVAVDGLTIGQPAQVQVRRGEQLVEVEVAPAEYEGRPVLGVLPTTKNPRVELPLAVDVAAGNTGGPSAGLMIALTVYDKVLPGVDLAQGRTIAGTGEIDDTGRVGGIGGAGLKVVAAHRAGADVFLVPAVNHAEAAAMLPPGSAMKVIPVETFAQARRALGEAQQSAVGDADDPDTCPYANAA